MLSLRQPRPLHSSRTARAEGGHAAEARGEEEARAGEGAKWLQRDHKADRWWQQEHKEVDR